MKYLFYLIVIVELGWIGLSAHSLDQKILNYAEIEKQILSQSQRQSVDQYVQEAQSNNANIQTAVSNSLIVHPGEQSDHSIADIPRPGLAH